MELLHLNDLFNLNKFKHNLKYKYIINNLSKFKRHIQQNNQSISPPQTSTLNTQLASEEHGRKEQTNRQINKRTNTQTNRETDKLTNK